MYRRNYNNIIPAVLPYILSASLVVGGILSVPRKKEQCNLSSTYHVHLYTREIGNATICKWLHDEKDTFYYKKNDDLLPVTSFDLELFDKLEDYNLFDGRENIDYIHHQITTNKDYMKFYYYYEEVYYETDEKGHKKRKTMTYSGWTDNPLHRGVTGKVRVFHRRYYAYNAVYCDGKLSLNQSDGVDDIREIIYDYPYMSENTNYEVFQDFRFHKWELLNLNLEDFDPFYTPEVENNPIKQDSKSRSLTKAK